MKFIDLFAGVGGFRYGFDRATQKTQERTRQEGSQSIRGKTNQLSYGGPEGLDGGTAESQQYSNGSADRQFTCVYSNEWDKYANSVYRKHYGECDNRDIRTVPSSDIPDHDLLVGGFPCQAFSVAGKRAGFDDTRGTLFFEIARILRDKRPRYFILENVKGLLSHDSGKTFQTILRVLSDIGYGVQWQVLNSKDFGVPQNRERIFIIGHLRGTPRPQVFPLGGNDGKALKEITRNVSDAQRIYNSNGIAKTLKGLGGGMGAKTGLYAVPVLTPDRAEKRQNGRRFKTNGEPSFTLTSQDRHGVMVEDMAIRRLTPIECERLQGFPDCWTATGADGEKISDTQRYKMMGNVVTTLVITEIGRKLIQTKEVNQI